MANRIRTEPVSLNESTLETNIASEIASIFNSPFNFGYPSRLRWLFEFDRINFNSFRKRKTKLYRLTPIEENKGGGWDTKIVIPRGRNERRAIFIQFKSGKHSNGNTVSNSAFNINKSNPNLHAEFKFNDNTNNNQHQTLKTLSDNLLSKGFSSKSVMYAFPRVTELEQFEKLEEDLILYTTFLTMPEIDSESRNNNVNLYDGNTHHFRTCYFDENKREIASTPFLLDGKSNVEDIIFEILLVKISHYRNQIRPYFPYEFLDEELSLMLADYLKINPENIVDFDRIIPRFNRKDLNTYFDKTEKNRNENFTSIFGKSNNTGQFNWRYRVFERVYNFFNQRGRNRKVNIREEIPSQFTLNLTNDEYEFGVNSDEEINLMIF